MTKCSLDSHTGLADVVDSRTAGMAGKGQKILCGNAKAAQTYFFFFLRSTWYKQ